MKKNETAVYEMKRDGWNDYFLMHVSKSSESMRSYIESKFKEWGCDIPKEGWDGTRGLVHPTAWIVEVGIKDKKLVSLEAPFAHLFLAEDYLGVGVVAHECLHVAMTHERFVIRFKMQYGQDIDDDEERLAYFLSSCVRGVYNTLYEHGHIKEVDRA